MTVRALAALGLAAALLAACSPAKPDKDADKGPDLSAQLEPAFEAAFGGPGPAAHEAPRDGKMVSLQYSPVKLADLGDGRVALVSTAVWPDGCPQCGGAVAVHYLTRTGMAFHVDKAWYDLGPSGTFGDAPDARVRLDLFERPTLQAETSDRVTGCEMTHTSLYELTPAGPVLRARDILAKRDNIPMGAMRSNRLADYYGNVLSEGKGKGFSLHYHGTTEGDVPYAAGPDGVWKASGGIALPPC